MAGVALAWGAGPPAATPRAAAAAASAPAEIDINSASRAQLKTLPGIGNAEADRIIAGRPYLSKTHLVADAGIPAGVYQSIRHRIVAVPNAAARAKLQKLVRAKAEATASQPKAP